MEDNTDIKDYSEDILLIVKYITNKISKINEENNNDNNNNNENVINNLDEKLFKYCDKNKFFNEKGTKLLNELEFNNLISILEKYITIDDYIIPFFEKLNIFLIKVIINGYISYKIEENKKEKILLLINKLVPLMTHTDYIYFIYHKLSKIFRLELKDDLSIIDESFKKFNKIFDIWKLIFSYDEELKLKERYISFYGNNNIEIKISDINANYVSTVININFIKSQLLSMNNDIENFSLIKIFNSNGDFVEVKAKDIQFKDNKSLSDINSIRFIISDKKVTYIIDNNNSTKEEIKNDNINNINKIELLNDCYGKISSIEFIRKFKKKIAAIIRINPNRYNIKTNLEFGKETFANQYKPLPNNQDPNIKENIEINLKNNLNIFCKYYPIDKYSLSNIKYFGGFDAFIPIFKILKYFIINMKTKEYILTLIKDILKIIINKVCTNEKSLENLFEIIVPLTGALSEIISNIPKEESDKLLKDDVIYNLYFYIIISPLPKTVKYIFKEMIGLNDNDITNLNINYKNLTLEKNLLKINSIDWYCFILFTYIEFNLLVYNDIDKVPKELFEQLYNIFNSFKNDTNEIYKNIDEIQKTKILIIVQFYIGIINNFYPDKIENFKEFKIINDLYEFINGASFIKKYLANICFLMIKIFLELNNLELIKNKEKDSSYDKFYNLFLSLKNIFIKQDIDNPDQKIEKEDLKNKFKESFINYEENKDLLYSILNSENNTENNDNNIDFISQGEKMINQFIDYERQYRHLMKEQFIFNHFWSNKKLFFDEKIKSDELKYKSVNYYTENFQRPIIYPYLDYKYQYPSFSFFVIDNNFYIKEESKDNYIFFLESQELEDLIDKYHQINLESIQNNFKDSILTYDVCLIKRTHHVKGKLFLIQNNSKFKEIYFLSHQKRWVDTIPSCNNLENNAQQQEFRQTIQNKHVCYGSYFICPDKDCNIKIKINIEDIRMIIRRIYFYRKSALEIFTWNKSYYFNLCENPLMENYKEKMGESNSIKILTLLTSSFNFDLVPIEINNVVIGYSKEFNYQPLDIMPLQLKKDNSSAVIKGKDKDKNSKEEIQKEENKFIENLLKRWINEENHYSYINNEISTFDIIILLNLLSNRSYNDLYQYPVFPLLFFYEKDDNNPDEYLLIPRTLNNHIGFQTDTKSGETKKKYFVNIYEVAKEEINDGISDIQEAFYFNAHYSNGAYTCNFLLRIFPYSFIAIEIQGDGFDDPNRLFNSIDQTLKSMSSSIGDLREILPEFYFLPEMLLNINKLNFKKKSSGKEIDNVEIPKIIKGNVENNDRIACFKFIEYMRNKLEERNLDVYNWLNLIFGNRQKYNNMNKLDQFFRTESYLNFDRADVDRLNSYLKNDIIMSSFEFGIIPIQILFTDKVIKENSNNSNYSSINKDNIESKLKSNIYKDKKYIIELKKDENQICENKNNYSFKKGNKNIGVICNNLGKIEIYLNGKLLSEFYDQKNIIKYIDYNKRLNMLVTTSIDGYSCIYSLPNKLVSVIKHPNKGYFDYIVLSSNPFPTVIAYDKKSNDFYSYSLNGIFIHKVNLSKFIGELDKLNDNIISIYPIFDTDGGTNKDLLVIQDEKDNNVVVNLPFFEKIDLA